MKLCTYLAKMDKSWAKNESTINLLEDFMTSF